MVKSCGEIKANNNNRRQPRRVEKVSLFLAHNMVINLFHAACDLSMETKESVLCIIILVCSVH